MSAKYFRMSTIKAMKFEAVNFDVSEVPSGYELIHISLPETIKYWSDNNWYQRSHNVTSYGHDLPFDGYVKNIKSLMSAVIKGASLPPVLLSYSHEGNKPGICFPDGRHRITLFSIAGLLSIPAIIKSEDVHLAQQLIVCNTQEPRVLLTN